MAWLYQRPDSKRWWIGYRINGEQVLKSTGTTDKAEAEKQMAKLELMLGAQRNGILTLELYQQISGRTLPTATLKAALDDWIKEAEGATRKATVSKYRAISLAFSKHLHATEKGPLVADVTRDHISEFLTEKRANVTASTVNTDRKCLAVFFRRCQVNGVIRENPMLGVRPFKAGRDEARARRPFTATELSDLYSKAPDEFWRYMVLGGFYTGLRLGDLVTVPIGAVDLSHGTINILTRKTGATMHIPIAKPLLDILTKLIAERRGAKPTDPLWPKHAKQYEEFGGSWFSQRFYDLLLVKAGLVVARPHCKGKGTKSGKRTRNAVSFHCFRHSYVSTLAALGQNQQIVKELSGHSSDEVNDLYTKLPADVLRGAVALLPDITPAVPKAISRRPKPAGKSKKSKT